MQNSKYILQFRPFIWYKLYNSFFLGLSVGSIFIIYAPLEPSIYSVGGILLAIAMLVVAKFYTKIMNIDAFYKISMFVEFLLLAMIAVFLLFSYSYMMALLIYAGYQATFAFGSYLIRAETIFLKKSLVLGFVDVAKQKGYLAGMAGSYLFYKVLEYGFEISDSQDQVYYLHYLLLGVQALILYYLNKAFKNDQLSTTR